MSRERGAMRSQGQLKKRGREKGRGQSIVELALTVPIIALLMLGTLDLGRMYYSYVDLKEGVRNGARYGALKPADTAGIQAKVLESGVPANTVFPSGYPRCVGVCGEVNGTGTIEVRATSDYSAIFLGFLTAMGVDGTITLTATASMRVLS